MFYAGDIFVFILQLGTWRKACQVASCRGRHKNWGVANGCIDGVSRIRNYCNRVVVIYHRTKVDADQIQLVAEHPNGSIERHLVVVTSPIEVELGLAITPWVVCNSKARCPVICKA